MVSVLCLIYFIQHNTFKIYTHYHAWQDFIFLWLSSIPLHVCVHKCVCVCVCVCVCIHLTVRESCEVNRMISTLQLKKLQLREGV